MKNLGNISDNKDIVTKEYLDNRAFNIFQLSQQDAEPYVSADQLVIINQRPQGVALIREHGGPIALFSNFYEDTDYSWAIYKSSPYYSAGDYVQDVISVNLDDGICESETQFYDVNRTAVIDIDWEYIDAPGQFSIDTGEQITWQTINDPNSVSIKDSDNQIYLFVREIDDAYYFQSASNWTNNGISCEEIVLTPQQTEDDEGHLYWDYFEGSYNSNKILIGPATLTKAGLMSSADKAKLDGIGETPNIKIYRNTTGTAAKTTSPYTGAKWDISDTNITAYTDGMMISIKVPVAGSATYGTALQINSLGYHPVVYNVSSMIGTRYGVGGQVIAVYNATQTASWYNNSSSAQTITGCWQIMDYDANDVNHNNRDYYLRRTAADAIYRYIVCVTDGKYIIPINTTNNSTSSTKTSGFTTREFDPFCNIYYYNTTTTITANSLINSQYFYNKTHLADLRYTFNGITTSSSTSKFVAGDAIYLVCVPQKSGKVKLYYGVSGTDYAACLTKTLPTAEDGLVYIYLGQMYDTYRVELSIVKRPYYFKDGKICEYAGENKIIDVLDNNPYLFRASGGDANVGYRVSENWIEGGSIAVNQLIPDSYTSESISYGGGTGTKTATNITLTGTTGTYTYASFSSRTSLANHIYLIIFNVDSYSSGISSVWCKANNKNTSISFPVNTGIFATVNKSTGANGTYILGFSVSSGTVSGQTMTLSKMQEIDLTRMFGSTIANYLATLSNDEALAKLKPWIDVNIYHPYNAGSIASVNLVKKETVGFNQWDEAWETGTIDNNTGAPTASSTSIRSKNYRPCLGGMTYYGYIGAENVTTYIHWYNADKMYLSYNRIRNELAIAPDGARFFKIKTYDTLTEHYNSYNKDICINISDPSRNGTYKPYEVHEYTMPSGDLRGVLKLVSNNIVYDGDRYYPDGHKEIRYAAVNLGTLTWSYSSSLKYFSTTLSDAKPAPNTSTIANIICARYVPEAATNVINSAATYNKSISINQSSLLAISDQSYTSAASFKTAMSGVYLVYEKATSSTSTVTSYQQTQLVDNLGTEEFIPVTGNSVPVGHNSTYYAGFEDKLISLPENAPVDGLYLIRQSGKQQYLEPYVPETCVAEGTLITMSDFSTKPVENLQVGDEVLSYDVINGTQTTAIILDNNQTGSDTNYTLYTFSDASSLLVYGIHDVYDNFKQFPRDITNWDIDDVGLNVNNEEIQLIDSAKFSITGGRRHFNPITSNCLYYANGILCGHKPSQKYANLKRRRHKLTPAIMNQYYSQWEMYSKRNDYRLTAEYASAVVGPKMTLNSITKQIDTWKKNLADTDYLVLKYAEGLITESEWLIAKAERAQWRRQINELEPDLLAAQKAYDKARKRYSPALSEAASFRIAQEYDNEHLDEIKALYENVVNNNGTN